MNEERKQIDVTDIVRKHVKEQGGQLEIPASDIKLSWDHPGHVPSCTWPCYVAAGETPPGQSFWGQLNYSYCQQTCFGKKPSLMVRLRTWYKWWFKRDK